MLLGYPANQAGSRAAFRDAKKIGADLSGGLFQWELYLPKPEEFKTVKDWITEFESDYFNRRPRNIKSELTWKTDYHFSFKRLPPDAPLTAETVKNTILAIPEAKARTRSKVAKVLATLCRFAEIEFDAAKYKGEYTRSSVDPRSLPTDKEIVEAFRKITTIRSQVAYGLMATYGLRNHEVFLCNPETFTGDLIEVTAGKTGRRLVYPLYPEWIDLFGITAERIAKLNPVGERPAHDVLGRRIYHIFVQYKIKNFKPYDLRHSWARRAIIHFPIDARLAAAQM
ncbi:MAG: hypothetical protein AAGG02_11085, partial [Cyanobacteria bacterium P01_H01_bin.15]